DEADRTLKENMTLSPPKKVAHFKLACKNFKTVWIRYLLVSCVFSIGILCMIFSLSSGNIIEKSISDFKEKNVAFNNGYVKNDEKSDIYKRLNTDDRLENVYKQYKIDNVSLSMDTHSETMGEKYPMPKTKESMSYGTMPQNDKKEIALTPSLAKKFNSKINELIGKEIILEYQSKKYVLKVSGIYNAGYDDFFVSSDIEKEFYKGLDDETYYSVNYDVKDFENIVAVSDELAKEKIQSENASEQVKTMQNTFNKIQTLFMVISGMILFVAMFVVIIILIKMQSTRYKMVGLLYSFGFQKNMVSKIIVSENILLTILAAVISSLLLIGMLFIARLYYIDINLSVIEFVATILISSLVILLINAIINRKLINTRPNIALRK
ncbi:FtsX-like permease family protein, partial [Clostridioides difficile]|nr:FtsX-like permease family protein [Clostridioides difficile]